MNRLLIACALAACEVPHGAVPEPDPGTAELGARVMFTHHLESAPAPRPLYAATRTPLAPQHVITSIHGGMIHVLAVTSDGNTAVTADVNGAVRLWPTLDGTREPVVVVARPPTELAIARDGDAVVIAGLDAVGQLELVRTTAIGREDERIAVDTPRPLVAVRAVGSRFVAIRDDQTIVAFDAHGVLVGALAASPGERISSVEVAGDRALAVTLHDRVVRGRWLELSSRLAWGERTARLSIDPARGVSLAPSATRLAAVSRDHTAIVIVDLASGKIVETPYGGNADNGEMNQSMAVLAFADETTLLVVAEFAVQVWREGVLQRFDHMRGEAVVGAAGELVMSQGDALVIETGGRMEFLGYSVAGLSSVLARRDGLIATDASEVVRIDRALHADHLYALPTSATTRWHTVHLLDDRHALVFSDRMAWVVDLESTADPVKLPFDGAFLGYQLATRVLALRTTTSYVFARFDPKTGAFAEPLAVPMSVRYGGQVFLLDPAVAHGHVAAIVEPVNYNTAGPANVTELAIEKDAVIVAGTRSIDLTRPFWDDQQEVAEEIDNVPQTIFPSPRGDTIAVVADQKLTLRTRAGAERWSRRLDGTGVVWTPAGELIVYGSGLARVDLDTGKLADRQCGWQFGRYPEHLGSFAGAALCEAQE